MGNPSFDRRAALVLEEIPPPRSVAGDPRLMKGANAYIRTYRLGECTVIVTREFGRWHLSIAHESRYPSWDEIAEARYRVLPDDVTMGLDLPPKSEYVNIHRNCFQIVEVLDAREIPVERVS
jgi:hypothetical protein